MAWCTMLKDASRLPVVKPHVHINAVAQARQAQRQGAAHGVHKIHLIKQGIRHSWEQAQASETSVARQRNRQLPRRS